MSSSIGERFDFALKELKITNKEIAESFNISSQNVSNLKKNDRLNDLISQIATKYNINLNWLVTGKGNYIIEEQSIQDDKNKTNNNDLSKYFIALQYSTNEAEILIDNLLSYYNVSTYSDLGIKINTTQQTVSKWKQRNSINAIKKKCKELGIYNEIFKNTNKEDLKIEVLEKSLFNDNINKTLEIINTMTKDNKELEDKFHLLLKEFIKENI